MAYSNIMIRIGETDKIERQFNEGYLRFGCPANWINYAEKYPDSGTADRFEAVFAHVKKDDPRIIELGGGDPFNQFFGFWNEEGPDDTVYLRNVAACLVPAICFFSIDLKDAVEHFKIKGNSTDYINVNLLPFYRAMIDDPKKYDQYSALIFTDPGGLLTDLKREVPKLVSGKIYLVKRNFNPDEPIYSDYVDYDLNIEEAFWNKQTYDAVYRKQPTYREQHEVRIIIPHVTYMRHPSVEPYLTEHHEMDVPVPNIKDYAMVIPVSKFNGIRFVNFTEDLSECVVLFFLAK